ncbi:MAG: hypothetical protein J6D29_04480 [Solobacterium sp.]|nr:hypothetical protein [Solobacterium sp.]
MYRRSSDWWFWIFLFLIFGGSSVLPLFFILGIVFLIMHYAVRSSTQSFNARQRANSYGYYERKQGNTHTASDLAKINVYLRKYFRANKTLSMPNDLELVLRTQQYSSLTSLDVYRNNVRLGSLNEFRNRYGELYASMFDTLLAMAKNSYETEGPVVVDAEYADVKDKKQEAAKKEEKATNRKQEKPGAQFFMDKINSLNDDIPDTDISNGLYETCALLKQVQILEEKFPDSTNKMNKMYEYYLPYLIKILSQYSNLQNVKSDVNYEKNVEKLKGTVHSINEALNTIIPSMSDTDFTNLSVDMATLEALLQKDGLTGGMQEKLGQSSKE